MSVTDEQPSNAALLVHLDYIRKAADLTNEHLQRLNGRVGETEQKIAVLEAQTSDARTAGAKYGGIVGGIITGGMAVWQFLNGAR